MMISIEHIANNDVHRRAPHTYPHLIPQTFAYYSEPIAHKYANLDTEMLA